MLPILILTTFSIANAGYSSLNHHNTLSSRSVVQHVPFISSHLPITHESSSYVHSVEEHVPVIVNGVPVETPEVQRAKAEHFAAVAKAKALAANSNGRTTKIIYRKAGPVHTKPVWEQQIVKADNDNAGFYGNQYDSDGPVATQIALLSHQSDALGHDDSHRWRYKRSILSFGAHEQHIPIITKEGVPLDTPEVLQAKAQHFQAVENARLSHNEWKIPQYGSLGSQNNGWASNGWTPQSKVVQSSYKVNHGQGWNQGWNQISHGPQHIPVLDKNGVPFDTPEVQLAKQQHFLAIQEAKLKTYWNGRNNGWAQSNGWVSQPSLSFSHSPLSSIGQEGVPIETPEVQIAKAQHLAIHAQEKAKHSGWIGLNQYASSW